mgnify:CR=1 FL=1
MSKISLGVNNVAYTDSENPQAMTTHEVAVILENNYDVMGTFVGAYQKSIEENLASVYKMLIHNYIETGSAWGHKRRFPMEKVTDDFRDYLSRDEWQQITGRTIMVAVMGISHRKGKKTYVGPRPAFIDTGLYRRSFRAFLYKK